MTNTRFSLIKIGDLTTAIMWLQVIIILALFIFNKHPVPQDAPDWIKTTDCCTGILKKKKLGVVVCNAMKLMIFLYFDIWMNQVAIENFSLLLN